MNDPTKNSDEDLDYNPLDRLPSEVFGAIKSLEEKGTKDLRLSARTEAIKTLLDLLQRLERGDDAGTYYDELAIQAWKDGELPPKPSPGRKPDFQYDRRDKIARKIAIVERYHELKHPADPRDQARRPIEQVAHEFDVPSQTVESLLKSGRHHKAELLDFRHGFSEIHEMWFEWEWMRKNGLIK